MRLTRPTRLACDVATGRATHLYYYHHNFYYTKCVYVINCYCYWEGSGFGGTAVGVRDSKQGERGESG